MLKFEFNHWHNKNPVINRIINSEITGTVLSDALGSEQLRLLTGVIERLKPTFFTDLNDGNGFSLPAMFGQLHKSLPTQLVDNYKQGIGPFCSAADEAAGTTLGQHINNWLADAFSPYNTLPLPDLLPYSFRIVYPGRGGLSIHKDGELLPFIHDSVSHLIETYIQPHTMMSWYFTVLDPAMGGELWVADSDFGHYKKDGPVNMAGPRGDLIVATEMPHTEVKTPTGSLLMFKGGNHWHKVNPPAPGNCNRITMGGFMALSQTGDTIYYWS